MTAQLQCNVIVEIESTDYSKQAVPELMREDSAEFQSMFRMDMMAFEQLLDMVAPQIAKENTVMRMNKCTSLPN